MTFDLNYIWKSLPALMSGLGTTLIVSCLAILFSLVLGVVGCSLRMSKFKPAALLAAGYVEFIRGTPYLVQIFFIFYGLPSLGFRLSIFWSGVLALTIWASAFHIETFRAGLSAVSRDIHATSASLGLRGWQHGLLVVFPIALRAALPSTLNTVVGTIKNSAFLEAIGLVELTYTAVERISQDYRVVEMFLSICVIYLILIYAVSTLGTWLERRLNRPYTTG